MISVTEAAVELLARRKARVNIHEYIRYSSPLYKTSVFSAAVCAALDKFVEDVQAGKRPILILQAPPQHGKSEMVSRRLPAYLMGRFPNWRIGGVSYNDDLASAMAQDVRRNLASPEHQNLFPAPNEKRKFDVNRTGEFTSPGGTGSYVSAGVGSGLTGKPLDIGIIDDPVKNEKEALSTVTKEGQWNWYQSVFTTRLSEKSGQIIMATAWAEDDLVGRVGEHFRGDPRLTHLRFPAINLRDEVGFNIDLPEGPLVPELHSLEKLYETKGVLSDYWWSAMYQQSPKALGGNVFKESTVQYYLPKQLPKKFDKVIASWDCTFKDTDGTDFVVGQVWGKHGANAYLLDQVRARMSFSTTVKEIVIQRKKHSKTGIRETLIEDKANGPAVIDVLKATLPGIIAIEPDGSKLARAHAVTCYWEALNIFLPHETVCVWVRGFVSELTSFPAAAHDDQVDAMTQALRRLYPLAGKLKISRSAINKALGVA
jgi:predicted phage terminase large subunit-like protein